MFYIVFFFSLFNQGKVKRGNTKRLQWCIISTINPDNIHIWTISGNATKNLIGSIPFQKLMCYSINTLRDLRSGLNVEILELLMNIFDNWNKIPIIKGINIVDGLK